MLAVAAAQNVAFWAIAIALPTNHLDRPEWFSQLVGTLADTLWHWLALVLDRQVHVLRLYLDGAEIAQVSTSSIRSSRASGGTEDRSTIGSS